ncbi:hypothetical protein V5F77_14500 [Xanthobacter sp. DSM 24535]|uniref:hypothetical protein n=1 Tax=Roseixanthobacter psychrophilus TaxID=3119917 RepID=UPI00372650E8
MQAPPALIWRHLCRSSINPWGIRADHRSSGPIRRLNAEAEAKSLSAGAFTLPLTRGLTFALVCLGAMAAHAAPVGAEPQAAARRTGPVQMTQAPSPQTPAAPPAATAPLPQPAPVPAPPGTAADVPKEKAGAPSPSTVLVIACKTRALAVLKQHSPSIEDIFVDMDGLTIAESDSSVGTEKIRHVLMGEAYIQRDKTDKVHRFLCLTGDDGKVLMTFFTER